LCNGIYQRVDVLPSFAFLAVAEIFGRFRPLQAIISVVMTVFYVLTRFFRSQRPATAGLQRPEAPGNGLQRPATLGNAIDNAPRCLV
jgi:hypothetical protein